MPAIEIPLAHCADEVIGRLARATGSKAFTDLDGATLLGERAMLAGMAIPGAISAGGGCGLYNSGGDSVALNLVRSTDRELLPALFATDQLSPDDDRSIAAHIAASEASALVARGRSMGLAIAAEHEARSTADVCVELIRGPHISAPARRPLVIDLSSLWAGPLAAHLLWLAGAEVIKVESRTRPDAMRDGDAKFYSLLNQGKASVVLDFSAGNDLDILRSMIAAADIVIEAARPRALAQLGIDAPRLVHDTPGLVWITITAHGAEGDAANWVGFGDDCGVAGGLSAALHDATGHTGFVGDAIADPLTGIFAALTAWESWSAGRSGRYGLAMSNVVANCLAKARAEDSTALDECLLIWGRSQGKPFSTVKQRPVRTLPALGEHTDACRTRFSAC
jgi:hypothetical protein